MQSDKQLSRRLHVHTRRKECCKHKKIVRYKSKPLSEVSYQAHVKPVTFSEEGGVRYLHFGTKLVQGAMRLKNPFDIEFEYVRQMMAWLLFLVPPKRIVQLGLGAGTLTKFCYRHFPRSHIDAVELNPQVIVAARRMFELPPDDLHLRVLQTDAWDFVNDQMNHGTIGVMQIDLYNQNGCGPALDSIAFYRGCFACLENQAILIVNLFGGYQSFSRNIRHLRIIFNARVVALPELYEGNRVVLAFSGPTLSVDWSLLIDRAKVIEKTYGLNAAHWVDTLRAATSKTPYHITPHTKSKSFVI
ncbi:spermidine synthase [Candidatus Vallotia lariciata]|uniref:spermidine synthase n=1 Tax=Candidatus Vallotia laricis TaxID=2018052 RepID=UPI001D030EB1|nr:spermidine synthase [Candidatus Vallotia lariciata]UDG83222.1 Polyamine aminopropyltransferase [Candidatus Vallotia lariciata]